MYSTMPIVNRTANAENRHYLQNRAGSVTNVVHKHRKQSGNWVSTQAQPTSTETHDRKCFSMQLILVVCKVDMINQICQMLSFC